MILNRHTIPQLICLVTVGTVAGATLPLPTPDMLLSWLGQILPVLSIVVAISGLVFMGYRLFNFFAGNPPPGRLPGDISRPVLLLQLIGVWLIGFGLGAGMRLLA